MKDGGPAFPYPGTSFGMSLRDCAEIQFIARYAKYYPPEQALQHGLNLADAWLAAREQRNA